MIHFRQWRANGLRRPLSQIITQAGGQSLVTSRAASLSAIHRGMRRSERVQFGEAEPSSRERSPRSDRVRFGEGEASSRGRNSRSERPQFREVEPFSRGRRPSGREQFGEAEPFSRGRRPSGRDQSGGVEPFSRGRRPSGRDQSGEAEPFSRGRRPSGRDQFGEAEPFSRGGSTYGSGRRNPLTHKALDGAASQRQQQKLRKKLDRKAADEEEEDSGRQTRRKRFLDPTASFGKKSLVYQLKHGALKDEAASLPIQEPVRPAPSRSFDPEGRFQRSAQNPRQDSDLSESRSNDWENDIREEAPVRGRKKFMMPMNIKYTTAASQFLYGKSVVKAALEQGRRMIYNLYIYGGENRKDSKDNAIITRLAERRGVPVTIVPNGEQRLMDKMSMGRPHNGFVLETSPLPQLPVTSLGRLEESPARLGFHVELDYQSKEEEAINGRETFVARKNDIAPKPFVLLLNEILDPGNLGALLRTASYLGVDAVGITNRSSSTLTPVVLKSAAGAVEEVTIFTVDSPVEFIEESKKAGWKTYAAVAPPELKLARRHSNKFISTDVIERKTPLASDPCILVLGNEGHGLSKPIKVAADYELSVPRFVQGSCVDSLNVSVAAGLLCHAFVKAPATEKAATKAGGEVISKEVESEEVESEEVESEEVESEKVESEEVESEKVESEKVGSEEVESGVNEEAKQGATLF